MAAATIAVIGPPSYGAPPGHRARTAPPQLPPRRDGPTVNGVSQPQSRSGRVVLVGAGPGDPELITVKGARALAEADVVVIDRLATRDLVGGLSAEIIDVGKTSLHHRVSQREIEALLIAHAQAGKVVVRLKGGDPFLLGRGGEEVQACRAAGVPVEVIPGVTSALAAPAAADIPVTQREVSKSVLIVSGHEGFDFPALARLEATLVVLMGMSRLHELSAGLILHGLDPQTPAAVVHHAFSPQQVIVQAPLDRIATECAARDVGAPGVIVVGQVARGLDALASE